MKQEKNLLLVIGLLLWGGCSYVGKPIRLGMQPSQNSSQNKDGSITNVQPISSGILNPHHTQQEISTTQQGTHEINNGLKNGGINLNTQQLNLDTPPTNRMPDIDFQNLSNGMGSVSFKGLLEQFQMNGLQSGQYGSLLSNINPNNCFSGMNPIWIQMMALLQNDPQLLQQMLQHYTSYINPLSNQENIQPELVQSDVKEENSIRYEELEQELETLQKTLEALQLKHSKMKTSSPQVRRNPLDSPVVNIELASHQEPESFDNGFEIDLRTDEEESLVSSTETKSNTGLREKNTKEEKEKWGVRDETLNLQMDKDTVVPDSVSTYVSLPHDLHFGKTNNEQHEKVKIPVLHFRAHKPPLSRKNTKEKQEFFSKDLKVETPSKSSNNPTLQVQERKIQEKPVQSISHISPPKNSSSLTNVPLDSKKERKVNQQTSDVPSNQGKIKLRVKNEIRSTRSDVAPIDLTSSTKKRKRNRRQSV